MPLLEDYQTLLEKEERRKTLFGNALSSLEDIDSPEQDEFDDPFNVFLQSPSKPAAPVTTELATKPGQSWLDYSLLEPLGAFLWGTVEAGVMADLWVPEEEQHIFTRTDADPQGMPGKLAGGAGHLAGFVLGAPLLIGTKAVGGITKGIVKATGLELGGKYAAGTAKKIGQKVVKKANQSGINKEFAEEAAQKFQNIAIRSRLSGISAKEFTQKTAASIDELAEFYVKTGKVTSAEAKAFSAFMKKNLNKRPLQDITDLWMLKEGASPFVGNLINEAVMFGSIDAVSERIRASAEGRDYDWSAPMWGGIIGASFGILKFPMFGGKAGKAAPTMNDIKDGARAAILSRPFKNKSAETLSGHSKWLGDVLEDAGETTIRSGKFGGESYRLNLKNPESIFSQFGEETGKKIIESELNALKNTYGRELITRAIGDEGRSLAQNWKRVLGSSLAMNSRTFYDIAVNDADVKFEDMVPGLMIGAWVGRHGQPRSWDMNKRVNRLRQNLKTLGVDTKNLNEMPTFDEAYTKYTNPMNSHKGMRGIVKKAEELEIISDNYDAVKSESLRVLEGDQSVAGRTADPFPISHGGKDLDVFHALYRHLKSAGKFTRSLDDISTTDAFKLQDMAQRIKWQELNNNPINNQKDMNIVMDRIAEGASERFENLLVDSIVEMGNKLGLDLNASQKANIGKLPSLLTYSREMQEMAYKGELEWLVGAEGKIMEGDAAIMALDDAFIKTGALMDFLKPGIANKRGGIGIATESNQRLEVINDTNLKDVYEIVNNLERTINESADMKNDRVFSLTDALEDIKVPMLQNQAKKASKGISLLFDKDNPNRETRDKLQALLKNVNLLQGTVLLPGGTRGDLRLIPDVSRIKITGAKDESAEAHAKKLLGHILSIAGAKGQYKLGARPTEDIEIPYSHVIGNTDQSLSHFLERQGMRTSPYLMDQYNTFTTNYILKEKVKGSDLDNYHLDFIHNVMSLTDVPFASFTPGGKGKAAGWALSKIELVPGMSDDIQMLASHYNSHVNTVIKAGKGLVSSKDKMIIDTPDVVKLLSTSVEYTREGSRVQAKEILLQFLNAIEMNHGAFKMMAAEFINSGNSQNAIKLMSWLKQYKLITREDGDLTRYTLNAKKSIDYETTRKLMNKMSNFGVSKEAAIKMQKIAEQEVNDMQFNHLGVKVKDQRLSRDQFFKRYFKGETDLELQDMRLEEIIYDSNGDLHRDAVTRLLSKMDTGGRVIEARDDAKHIILSQLAAENRTYFTYNNGKLEAESKRTVSTPFTKVVDDLGIGMVPILGSNQFFYSTPEGKIKTGRFSIFDEASDFIPTDTKNILRSNLDNLKESLNNLKEIDIKNAPDMDGERFFTNTYGGDPGMVLMRLMDGVQPFAILKSDLPNIVFQYKKMMDRIEKDDTIDISPKKWQEMQKDLERLNTNPESHMGEHTRALRTLLFEKLTTSSQDKSFFTNLINGEADAAKVATRFSLFHTPSYRYTEADFALNSTILTPREGQVARKYANKKTAGVAIWNDKSMADIYENLSVENQKFWDKNLFGRESTSAYDGISFISADYRDYLALSHGMSANAESRVYKPVISSNGDVLLFGKTAFVYDPSLEGFFKRNPKMDILTTKSASKIYGENQWKLMEFTPDQILNARNLNSDGYVKQLPLNAIGIKSDMVKDTDAARISQQIYNYFNSTEAGKVYDDMYNAPVESALRDVKTLLDNPYAMRNFFSDNVYDDSFVSTMVEGTVGSQKLGALRVWADHGNPMEIGEQIVMSQIYKKVLQPTLAPKAEVDGIRYGGKAVLMQSLDPKYRDLRFTKVTSDGKVEQYGEIVLPYRDQFEQIKTITAKNKDLKIKILDTKNNTLVDPVKRLGEDVWDGVNTLGDLHGIIQNVKNWQIAVVNTRYPRTRPNDLGILGLRGFGPRGSGNTAIVNPLDVLNIFEGDYDIDKSDYFWAQNETTFKHVQESKHRFVQGVDPGVFPSNIKGLELYNQPAFKENELWEKQISNSSTLAKGIGLVQKVPRIINHIRDLAELREVGKEEHHVIMEGKDWEIRVDYNNKDWFQRMVLEAQTIIDASSSINRDVLDQVYSWRDDFLFPIIEESGGTKGSWSNISDKIGFLREAQGGLSPHRVRIFRKFDKIAQKEVDLSATDVDLLKSLMKNYSDFIQLGTEIYDNTGKGKSPSYSDIIDNSAQFFNHLADLGNNTYWKFRGRKKDDVEFVTMYKPGDEVLKKSAEWKLKNIKDYKPEVSDFYRKPGAKNGPFPEAVVRKANRIFEGHGGNVFDRIMWKVWDTDPLSARDFKAFSADEMRQMDQAMQRFYGEADYAKLDELTANMFQFATSTNKAQGTLRYLKKQYGVISKLRISETAKKKRIEQLNESIKEVEYKILDMTSTAYKKTKSGQDLKDPLVKFLDLNDKEVQDGAVQYYTMHALSRVSGTKENGQMRKDIEQLRQFEKVAFADMDGLSETFTYGEARSFLTSSQRRWLENYPPDREVYDIINDKLEAGFNRYGLSFLFNYGSPLAHKNAIGIYNGAPMTVSYGPTKRFNRAMNFLALKAQNDPTLKKTLSIVAPIADHYRNYLRKDFKYLSESPVIDAQTGLNYDMLRFPKFQQTMQSSFDNFTSLKWNKASGKENPFQIMNDDLLSFYREIFKMNGQEKEFNDYAYQMSNINTLSMGSEIIDPFHYLSIMRSLETDVHNFVNKGLDGGFSPDGKFIPTEKMKNNPIWVMLGGENYIKGISMNPVTRATTAKWNTMIDYGKQANKLKQTNPKEGKSDEIFKLHKLCKEGK